MKLNLFLLGALLLLFMGLVKPQSLKLGLRFEPGILFSESNSKKQNIPVIFSGSANIIFEPIEWASFIIRPGITLIDEQYSGFEIGAFLKLILSSAKFYFISGINNHSNKAVGHNSAGGYGKEMLFASVGIGYQLDLKSGIDICYYWTNDKEYGYTKLTDGLTYSRFVSRQVNGILKLGLNLTWDIL